MSQQTVTLSFKQLPTLYLLYSQRYSLTLRISDFQRTCHRVSLRVLLVSCQHHLLWDIFTKSLYSFMQIKLTFTKFLWLHTQSLLNGGSNDIPTVRYFFYNSNYVQFEFHFQCCYFLVLCCTFIFVDQFPLSIFHFCKLSHRFITERRGGNITACFAICT